VTQNREAVVTQNRKTSKPESGQTQNGVNKLTKPLKWNENGGEKENSKLQTKTKPNRDWKRKWNDQNV